MRICSSGRIHIVLLAGPPDRIENMVAARPVRWVIDDGSSDWRVLFTG